MEGTRQTNQAAPSPRSFREQAEPAAKQRTEIVLQTKLPLEVAMTDEPGGDPYNHTGRFRRMYR